MPPLILLPLDFLIVAGIFTLLSGAAQRIIGRSALTNDKGLDFLVTGGLGLGFLCGLVFILLSLGVFTKGAVLLFLAACVPLAWEPCQEYWRSWKVYRYTDLALTGWEKVLIALIGIAAVSHLVSGYAPPAAEDELVYQMALPQLFANAGYWVKTPDMDGGFYPLNAQMMFTPFFLFRGTLIVKMVVWFSGIGAAVALWLFARRCLRMERKETLLAIALFTLMPYTTSLHAITSSDLLNIFFQLLVMILIWSNRDQNRLSVWAMAGVLAGISLGMRPYSLMWMAGMILFLLLFERRYKECFLFSFVAGMVYVPWPLRTFLLTGNPFYPMALWKGAATNPYISHAATNAYAGLFAEIFRLPVYLSAGPLIWGTGVLPIALAPLAYTRKPRKDWWGIAFLIITISLLTMALPFRMARYFGQAFPLIALCAGRGFHFLENGLGPRLQKSLRAWVILMLIVPNMLLAVYSGAKRIPFLIGRESTEDYLRKKFDYAEGYDMMHYINGHVPPSSHMLVLGGLFSFRYYYPQLHAHGMAYYPPAFYSGSSDQLSERFKTDGITYILIQKQNVHPRPDGLWEDNYFGTNQILITPLAAPAFKIIYENPKAILIGVAAAN